MDVCFFGQVTVVSGADCLAYLVKERILWGLAAGGEPGVTRVLDLLRDELDLTMALCGCPSIWDVTKDLIA